MSARTESAPSPFLLYCMYALAQSKSMKSLWKQLLRKLLRSIRDKKAQLLILFDEYKTLYFIFSRILNNIL